MDIRYKINKRLETINTGLVNAITGLTGLAAVLAAFIIRPIHPGSEWVNILVSIGCSLIAASLVSWLSSRYIVRTNRVKDIVNKWGLEAIFKTRQKMNSSCDAVLSTMEKRLDIIAWGLKSFRDSQDHLIKQKVKKGLKIRIITPDPDSEYVLQREKAEQEVEGQIRQTIINLGLWVDELKSLSPDSNNVQIKFYRHLPEDFYFRVDEHLFIGPYLYGISSQQTISYEFKGLSEGFAYYDSYFEKLWNDSDFGEIQE